jgi:NADH dehydrogenase FAD-containing subunit
MRAKGHRVVIVGAGPAGVAAAKRAKRKLRGAEVTLIDRSALQTNVPDLPAVLESDKDVQRGDLYAVERRTGAKLVIGEVESACRGQVHLVGGTSIGYDTLLVCAGAVSARVFGEHTTPARTAPEVRAVRKEIEARIDSGQAPVKLAILGSALSGLEFAAAAKEGFNEDLEVTLIGSHLDLPTPEEIPYGERYLNEQDVTLVTGAHIEAVDADGVHYRDAEGSHVLKADLFLETLGERGGAEHLVEVPVDDKGRVLTTASLQSQGDPNVWAAGAAAAMTDTKTGKPVKDTVKNAEESAKRIVDNVVRLKKGKAPKPFRDGAPGWVAKLGSTDAIGRVGPVQLRGWVAAALKNALLEIQSQPARLHDGWLKYAQLITKLRVPRKPAEAQSVTSQSTSSAA